MKLFDKKLTINEVMGFVEAGKTAPTGYRYGKTCTEKECLMVQAAVDMLEELKRYKDTGIAEEAMSYVCDRLCIMPRKGYDEEKLAEVCEECRATLARIQREGRGSL